MMVFYENTQGERINLMEWPVMLQEIEKLIGYEWKYVQTGEYIDSFYKSMATKSCTISIFADSEKEFNTTLNNMLEIFEKDVKACIPGKLYIGDYYINCFMYGKDFNEFEEDFFATDENLKIISPIGNWYHESLTRFRFTDDQKDKAGKGYPYGYDYDYAAGAGHVSLLKNDGFDTTEFVLIIYGYAQNPSITIGGNVYSLNCTIQEGDRLIIHSREKTITLIRSNDMRENYFRYRESGKNIFEKLPAGSDIPVYWNADFDFDIWTIEERSEPLWT